MLFDFVEVPTVLVAHTTSYCLSPPRHLCTSTDNIVSRTLALVFSGNDEDLPTPISIVVVS